MDDEDRDEHTAPGEAVEKAMPEPEEMPGGKLGRGKREAEREDPDPTRRGTSGD